MATRTSNALLCALMLLLLPACAGNVLHDHLVGTWSLDMAARGFGDGNLPNPVVMVVTKEQMVFSPSGQKPWTVTYEVSHRTEDSIDVRYTRPDGRSEITRYRFVTRDRMVATYPGLTTPNSIKHVLVRSRAQ